VSPFNYPTDVIPVLREAWQDWFPRDGDIVPLPADERLREILEVAYHASFTTEEQRQTAIAITVCEPAEADRKVELSYPRAFSVDEIRRLAPTARVLPLGVRVGSPPEIWGLCEYAYGQLSVKIEGPGALAAGRNWRNIVSLRAGQIQLQRGIPFDLIIQLFAGVSEELWRGINFPGCSWDPTRSLYPSDVLDVIQRIAAGGHGGTVIVVPEHARGDGAWRSIFRIKYACDDASLWPLLLEVVSGFDEPTLGRREFAEARVASALEAIADLAAVDGAVILTDRLRLLGFGAEVVGDVVHDQVRRDSGESVPIDSFGTRHRSACRFAARYAPGIVFVCSQDGGARCVRSVDGHVTMWP
jgi:hypothetical protein